MCTARAKHTSSKFTNARIFGGFITEVDSLESIHEMKGITTRLSSYLHLHVCFQYIAPKYVQLLGIN
jgi:hypothetical protein